MTSMATLVLRACSTTSGSSGLAEMERQEAGVVDDAGCPWRARLSLVRRVVLGQGASGRCAHVSCKTCEVRQVRASQCDLPLY